MTTPLVGKGFLNRALVASGQQSAPMTTVWPQDGRCHPTAAQWLHLSCLLLETPKQLPVHPAAQNAGPSTASIPNPQQALPSGPGAGDSQDAREVGAQSRVPGSQFREDS